MSISDHYTRTRLAAQGGAVGRVLGALMGDQKGRVLDVAGSFELIHSRVEEYDVVDSTFLTQKVESCEFAARARARPPPPLLPSFCVDVFVCLRWCSSLSFRALLALCTAMTRRARRRLREKTRRHSLRMGVGVCTTRLAFCLAPPLFRFSTKALC